MRYARYWNRFELLHCTLHDLRRDAPTVNDSPLGGREGTMLTSSAIVERLAREASSNISLQVSPGPLIEGMPDATEVRGRGELQMAVLIENMRREGFELSVSPPAVLFGTDAAGEKVRGWRVAR